MSDFVIREAPGRILLSISCDGEVRGDLKAAIEQLTKADDAGRDLYLLPFLRALLRAQKSVEVQS